jgi:hypothetical protein
MEESYFTSPSKVCKDMNLKEFKEDLQFELEYWYFRLIRDPYRKTKYGISNLWTWRKVIWNDYWWDDSFIFALLHKKFELMENNFRKNSYCVDGEKIADEIKIAKILCKRIIYEDYDSEECVVGNQPERDIAYLCDYIKKNVRKWWD